MLGGNQRETQQLKEVKTRSLGNAGGNPPKKTRGATQRHWEQSRGRRTDVGKTEQMNRLEERGKDKDSNTQEANQGQVKLITTITREGKQ